MDKRNKKKRNYHLFLIEETQATRGAELRKKKAERREKDGRIDDAKMTKLLNLNCISCQWKKKPAKPQILNNHLKQRTLIYHERQYHVHIEFFG